MNIFFVKLLIIDVVKLQFDGKLIIAFQFWLNFSNFLQAYPPPPTPVEAPQLQASITHSRQPPPQQFSLPRPVAAATSNPREVPCYDIDDCRPTNQIQPLR